MRLVCPKCVAQYEVGEQEIPEDGREVQCANCGHVWFQDRIIMFSEKQDPADTAVPEPDEDEIFDDLDGVSDVEFHSHHGAPSESDIEPAPDETEDIPESGNILSDDFDTTVLDEYSETDDAPNPEQGPALNADVLDVLRKEAEFSSHRDAPEEFIDQPDTSRSDDPDTVAIEEPLETDLDELNAFLSSYEAEEQDDSLTEDDTVPDQEDEQEEPQADEESSGQGFDPLADLEAIRSQLDSIGTGENLETAIALDDENIPPQETAIEYVDLEIDAPDLETVIGSNLEDNRVEEPLATRDDPIGTEPAPAFEQDFPEDDAEDPYDDFDTPEPRKAFRADGVLDDSPPEELEDNLFFAEADQNDTPEEPEEIEHDPAEPKEEAAIALGAMRPRVKKSSRHARNIEDPAEQTVEGTETSAIKPAEDQPAALTRPSRPSRSRKRTRRAEPLLPPHQENKPSRKELLPDVEELDSTLRNEADSVSQGEVDLNRENPPPAKSFGRAFIWTFLFLAVLVALYVMRPLIVSALPAAATVLDPYAAVIDSIRLMIESKAG